MPRVNKKILGLFKDEMNGAVITRFVGLRAKMYAIDCTDSPIVMRAKGVKKYVLQNQISFKDYHQCLKDNISVIRSQNTFRSKKHCVYSVTQQKIALNAHDNKRIISPDDNIYTLPWGYVKPE